MIVVMMIMLIMMMIVICKVFKTIKVKNSDVVRICSVKTFKRNQILTPLFFNLNTRWR